MLEAADVPGGRCGTATVNGYRFDTGPSVLTMPGVIRDTVGAAGEELDDWLALARLDPTYRLRFHDGSSLDILPGAERMAAEVERLAGPDEARRYLAFRGEHLGRMHEAEWPGFIDRNFDSPLDLARPLALARLARLGGFRRMHSLVATHLTDWRLRRAHTFQSLYVGISPFDALGIYAVIANGHRRGRLVPAPGRDDLLPVALAGVAEKAGATIRYGTRAEKIEAGVDGVTGVRLADGEVVAASDVVFTGDLPGAYGHLLPGRGLVAGYAVPTSRRRATWSTSGSPAAWRTRPTTPCTWGRSGRPRSRP